MKETVNMIKIHFKHQQYCIRQVNRVMNSCIGTVACFLGYSPDMEEDARKKYFDEARELVKRVEDGEGAEKIGDIFAIIETTLSAVAPLIEQRKIAEKELRKLAVQLPVWEKVGIVKGLGELSFAMLVGVAGDFSEYGNPAKVWKRFGVAVMDDGAGNMVRQGIVSGELGKDDRADRYTVHGYSPKRRSILWQVADTLLRQKNQFKDHYDRVKARELSKEINGKPLSKMHAHNRARRYASKELLKRIWCDWNGVALTSWTPKSNEDAA